MTLGCFSLSLKVKDINASWAFYEKLGFTIFHGQIDQGWLILAHGDTKIGLFQNMLEKNMLTFNPGWDQNAYPLDEFTDVRDIQKRLKAKGLDFTREVDETSSGPASAMLVDPDGNPILLDQHV